MINTIFYFPSSLTFLDYTTMLNNGEIAERTVVFADAQKAIYKGGKKYGGLSDQEFHDLIDSLEHDSWISDEISSVKGDIQSANTRINSVNSSVSDVNNRLTSAISSRDSDITSKVENLFKDSQWLQQNFPQGQTSWDSDWNSELESYLTQVGYWDIDSTTGQKTAKWSKLQNDISSISLEIANLTGNESSSQSLTTAIESMIEDDIAALNLNTTYASISDVNNAKNILEWLYSGLKSSAGQDKTFTELSSMTKSAFTSAISDIRTQVDKVANGDFVAQTEVYSKVGDTITNMLLQSSSDNALSALSAKANANSDNISALILGMTGSTSTANLSTNVSNALNNLTSGLISSADATSAINSAKTEIYSAIGAKDTNDLFISIATLKTQVDEHSSQISGLASTDDVSAGFVAKTDLDSAVASLVAQNGSSVKANIGTAVTNGISAATISANQIILEGLVTANNNFKIKSDGSMETIAGKIGGFNITSSSIYNGTTSLSDTTNGGVYVGTDGIRCNGTVSSDVWSGGITTNNLTASNIYIRPNMIYNDGLGDLSCDNLFCIDNLDKDHSGETEIFISRRTGGTTPQDHTANTVSIKPSRIHFAGSSYSSQMTSSSISITGSSSSASMDSDKLQVLSGEYGSYVGSSKIEYSYGLSVEMLNSSTVTADCAVIIDNDGFTITGPAPSSAQTGSTPTLMTVAKISKEGDATFLNLYSRELYIGEYLLDVAAAVSAGILVQV